MTKRAPVGAERPPLEHNRKLITLMPSTFVKPSAGQSQRHTGGPHRKTIHGLAPKGLPPHPVYQAWQNMRARCYNPKYPKFKYYGGRGIKVDAAWESSVQFIADMMPTWRRGLTLERKDNDGPYSKANCVWATRFEQAQNSRHLHLLEHNGKTQSIAQWARELKVPRWHFYLGRPIFK